jgi:hypothetical protein
MQESTIELAGVTVPVGAQLTDVIPIWVPAFFGDSNRTLKEVQRDCYSSLMFEFFDSTKRRYIDACDTLGVEPELVTGLAGVVMPDQPYLPRVYRKIAAWYRYAYDRESAAGLESEELRIGWEEFFRSEIHAVTSDEEIARAALSAAAFPGTKAAADEERVVAQLRYRYGEMTLPRRFAVQQRNPAQGDLAAVTVTSAQDPRVRPNPPD